MFKADAVVSDKKRFFLSFFMLIVCGAALKIFEKYLEPQFSDLIGALTSVNNAPISGELVLFYGVGWSLILLVGILCLCSWLIVKMAKKDLIAMMRNQK